MPTLVTEQLRFEWEVDLRTLGPRSGRRLREARDVVNDTLPGGELAPGRHRVRCRVTLADGTLLAEAARELEIVETPPPVAAPEGEVGRIYTRMTVSPAAGPWRELRGNLRTIKGAHAQSLEAFTGVPASDEPAFFAKATLNLGGAIRSDEPVRVWTPAELEADRGDGWLGNARSPGVKGTLSSGVFALGQMKGASLVWRTTQNSDPAWGTSWRWEFVGVVSAGNASLGVHAGVTVDAKHPEDDAAAQARFNELVGQAEGIVRGLRIDLE